MTREKKLNPHYRHDSNYFLHLVTCFCLISHTFNYLSRFFFAISSISNIVSYGLFERGMLLPPQEMKKQLIRDP